jgi:hypothetical protein
LSTRHCRAVRSRRSCGTRVQPADLVYGPRKLVQPDLFVAPLVDGVLPRMWEELGRPLLAVEVVSPSTAPTDRREKRELYQRKGMWEYWSWTWMRGRWSVGAWVLTRRRLSPRRSSGDPITPRRHSWLNLFCTSLA